jgi:predicted nucleotide-binding protein (sugar kinase/HSP70/actin superfamily)
MYNKYQRIVLDSFPELKTLRIASLTTTDGYSLAGMIDEDKVQDFRKAGYFSLVVADILDRLLWRIRPYEKEPGSADAFIIKAMHRMEAAVEDYGPHKAFTKVLDTLEEVVEEGKALMDTGIPRKPLIGIVGEIFVRMHGQANHDLIRVLERYGAEVVNASLAEWVNYISYEGLRHAKGALWMDLVRGSFSSVKSNLRKLLGFGSDLLYKEIRQKQIYRRVRKRIDIALDHKISYLHEIVKKHDLFSFDLGTEACLSIPAIMEYARTGCNGVVNAFPFTCMPSMTTSSVVKPYMNRIGVPYLDLAYDSTSQPTREAAIRTFMYQSSQHSKRNGGRS